MVLKIMVMPFRFILLDPLPCKKLSISWLYSSYYLHVQHSACAQNNRFFLKHTLFDNQL